MTLVEIIEYIQDFATAEHVNSSFVGDIYELNHKQDIEYPAFVITQGTHTTNTDEGVDTYNLNLFLVDRLTEDKSNELMVQDWAINGLRNILQMIEETTLGYSSTAASTSPFTERFDSLCAGAVMKLAVNVDINNCWRPRFVTSINGLQGDVYIPGIDPDAFYTKDEIDAKFNPKNNFKTINEESIIGVGNIEIKGKPDLSTDTISGISATTEISLVYDENGKLKIDKYSPIKIGTVSGGYNTEIGRTVNTVILNWSYTGSQPTSQTVDNENINKDSRIITLSGPWTTDKTFTVKGTDAKGNSSSGTASLKFYYATVYGIDEITADNFSSISGRILGSKPSATTKTNFTTNATEGKFGYFAIRKDWLATTKTELIPGTQQEPRTNDIGITFNDGSFDGGWCYIGDIDSPYTGSPKYAIYKTVNASLGNITWNYKLTNNA